MALWTFDIIVQFRTAYRDNETGCLVASFWPASIKAPGPNIAPRSLVESELGLTSELDQSSFEPELGGEATVESSRYVRGIALRYITRSFLFDLLAVVPCIYVFFFPNTAHEFPSFFQAGGSRIFKAVLLLDGHFFEHGFRRFVHTGVRVLEDKYGWDNWDYDYSDAYYKIDKGILILQQIIAFFVAVHVRLHC